LIAAIQSLEQADSENLRRLSFHTRNLSLVMTSRHLATVLVPFERLLGKALRDDEILIDEGDKPGAERTTAPLRVIADNLRSAFNVGAILRTAECFGVEHVSLSGYTPTPDQDKTARTSLGTEKSVRWSSDPNVHDVIAQAKRDGYSVIALETARSAVTLDEFEWPERAALLLGNERFGLDRDVLDQADHIVKIPMHGTKNSLNVGIACGITLASWRSAYDRRRSSERDANSKPNFASEMRTSQHVEYRPIAVFRSSAKHPYEAPRQASLDESGLHGTIELPSSMRETLKDIEGFERVWLIYDFHHNSSWKPLVLPPRGPHEKRGVFATRSPYRPNSIGLSAVKLIHVEGTTLTVQATDLLDGTPILDIKPYVPYADSFPDAKQGWLETLDQEKHSVRFSEAAESKLQWLEREGAANLRGFIVHQLEFDPLDGERKRVSPLTVNDGGHRQHERGHRLAYRTWRIDFTLTTMHESDRGAERGVKRDVLVTDLASGYSADDLAPGAEDKYADKDLHRRFLKQFRI
jgi:tRNA-Thr(GGU) m(6)t(6)A37 methyltransferase TsaA